jgi:hypothetical protein
MGKHHFTIKHEEVSHKCYLAEDGRVFVLGDDNQPRAVSAPTGIAEVGEAKEAARVMIESLAGKKR